MYNLIKCSFKLDGRNELKCFWRERRRQEAHAPIRDSPQVLQQAGLPELLLTAGKYLIFDLTAIIVPTVHSTEANVQQGFPPPDRLGGEGAHAHGRSQDGRCP